MNDPFDHRRRWFEGYTRLLDQGVKAPRKPGVRYTCPCCGYPTLAERGSYDICDLCSWEDDGQDDPHADEIWGGPNGAYSLSEARLNFKQRRIMYSPDKPTNRIGGNTNTPLEHQAKRAIMEAFDAMVEEADPPAMDNLWQLVFDNEKVLRSELERRIREYEARMTGGNTPSSS